MKSKPRTRRAPELRSRTADAVDNSEAPVSDAGLTIVRHPDGYYWVAPDGKQEFGPFDTEAEARADWSSTPDGAWEPGESIIDAEEELGIADWVDPDTGEPAEDARTRIEDH